MFERTAAMLPTFVSKLIAVLTVFAASVLIMASPTQAADANFGQCMVWVTNGAGSGFNGDYAPGQTGNGPGTDGNTPNAFAGSMGCPK